MAPHWQSFATGSTAPRIPEEEGFLADEQWQKENYKDLEGPWNPGGMGGTEEEQPGWWLFTPSKRSRTFENMHRTLMQNPFVPLGFRLMVLIFDLCALAVGVTIYRRTNNLENLPQLLTGVSTQSTNHSPVCEQQPSTYFVFILDSVAVIYLIYITWDEYFSRPLGLRRSRDKVRLLFLDLVFIVLCAANLSIAFNTLLDKQWACYETAPVNQNNEQAAESVCVQNGDLCRRQRALSGLLLIELALWLSTFGISVLRIVERISR